MRQTGCYAIQLYSGQITLSDPEFADLGADKPLRVLVLGQTKAGKSSLINALFGEVRAATDVLPCTDAITQYIFARPGLPNAIVFDTIGFAGKGDKAAIKKLDEELAQCDLVIAVCSANMAARDPDRKLLDQARLRFSANLKRAAPPIVVALSHVDKVRPFNEWNPPYNFIDGQSPKERNVGDAIGEVAKDLQVHRDSIMPVYLRQNRVYNVEEGLLPLIARILPAGERAKLLRISETATCERRLQRYPIGCVPCKTKVGPAVLIGLADGGHRIAAGDRLWSAYRNKGNIPYVGSPSIRMRNFSITCWSFSRLHHESSCSSKRRSPY